MTEVRVLCIPLKINDGGGRKSIGKPVFLCMFKDFLVFRDFTPFMFLLTTLSFFIKNNKTILKNTSFLWFYYHLRH